MPDVKAIQTELRANGLDGWLFFDHHHRDPIAARVLGLGTEGMTTRRWFYHIPSRGAPRKLVHRIEAGILDSLPGKKSVYSGHEELHRGLARLLTGGRVIAMQYSPKNNIPYLGIVDAGTIELIRSYGKKVVSSADLVQKFEAVWTRTQYASHLEAGKIIDRIVRDAFGRAAAFARERKALTEFELQQWIVDRFKAHGVASDERPIVAIGANSGNPHYEPTEKSSKSIRTGELLLLDVWGKLQKPGSVYYDITWTGFLGKEPPKKIREVFGVVRAARNAAVTFVQSAVAAGRAIRGWEVDRVARDVIRKAGYGRYFVHRTGHSIGRDVHGNGANMDGLETHDDRKITPFTCFSVEPGIYLPDFGIRSEVDVYVDESGASVTGEVQDEVLALFA
jgi:Xaa-Pro dipeptidase